MMIARTADFMFVPSQWETALRCNDVSDWQGASLESFLKSIFYQWIRNIRVPLCVSRIPCRAIMYDISIVVQSIWGQNGLNPPQIATKFKLALCCRIFSVDLRNQTFTTINRVEHFQIAQLLREPWEKIRFGAFYQYEQIHVYLI